SSDKSYTIVSRKQIAIESKDAIEHQLNKALEDKLLQEKGIDKSILDSVSSASTNAISVSNITVDESGKEKETNAGLAYGIGFGSGLLIYITMFIFGAMVMRGVMEEKMNRIAEVIISSVRPFQLMMGKIVGIAAVGLTQYLMWIILIVGLSSLASLFLSHDVLQQAQAANSQMNSTNSTMALGILSAKN